VLRDGQHYDWLLGDPHQPAGRLWTARVAAASEHWAVLRRVRLVPLAEHRRRYLTYQGPIAGDGGEVRRMDAGAAVCRLWTERRMVVDLAMRGYIGRVEIFRRAGGCWEAWFDVEALQKGLSRQLLVRGKAGCSWRFPVAS